MEFNTSLMVTVKNLSFIAVTSVFLIGCSSTQNVYDEDGIYSSSQTDVSTNSEQEITNGANTQVYKNYFEKGAQELSELEQDGAVFTDIDSYSSEAGSEIYVEGTSFETNTGYAAWGDEAQDVEINIYNNSPYWGGSGFGYGGYGRYGYGWGGGFYGNAWGGNIWSPWGYGIHRGYNSPFFGYGGYGYAYNSPFLYYGNNFNNHNHNYVNYGRNYRGNVSYNTGRRSSVSNAGRRSSAVNAISSSRSRLRTAAGRTSGTTRNTYSRNRGTSSRVIGDRPTSASRDGVTRGRPTSASRDGVTRGRPTSASRDGVTRGRPTTTSRPTSGSRPNATRPSRPSRPSGTQSRPTRPVRPSGTNSRPASSSPRPAATSNRSSSRSSSTSRSSSSRSSSGSSSRSSSGVKSGGRRG